MAVVLSWEIPNHVVKARLYGNMDVEGTLEFFGGLTPFLRDDGVRVHVFVDDNEVQRMPNLIGFRKALRMAQFDAKKPYLGYFFSIGGNILVKALMPTFASLVGINYKRVNTYDEIITYLKKIDKDFALLYD